MAADQNAYKNWFASLPIPWLVAGPNGQAEANAWPALLDYYVGQLVQARYQAFPDYCAPDALTHLGGDRKLVQGPAEANSSFQARLKAAFDTWPRAGSACGVLEQLAYFGQSNAAVWVQQNGLSYKLSGMPTPGQDPTSLVVSSSLSTLSTALTSSVNPPTTTSTGRSIPSGNSWWTFDYNTDNCNRFAIIYPTWPFSSLTTAMFSNSDSATITWPVPFASTSYSIMIGDPAVGVMLSADGTTQTTTGVTIRASAAWTGSATVIGYASGVNPLNFFSASSFGILKSIIKAWRPNSLCMGVYWLQSGIFEGYPTTNKFGTVGNFGGTQQQILGVF